MTTTSGPMGKTIWPSTIAAFLRRFDRLSLSTLSTISTRFAFLRSHRSASCVFLAIDGGAPRVELKEQEDSSADIDTVLVPDMSMVQDYSALRQGREVCLKRQGQFSLIARLVEDLEVSPSRSVLYKDTSSICPRSAPCGVLHLGCMIDTRSKLPRAHTHEDDGRVRDFDIG